MFKLFFKDKNEIKEIENYSNSDFSDFCIAETDKIIKFLRLNEIEFERFDFEKKLTEVLLKIKQTQNILSNFNNENAKTLNKVLSLLRENLDKIFRANYPEVINWQKETLFSQFLKSTPNNETNKILTELSWEKKEQTPGTEEYFRKEKFNRIFIDYKSYIIFFTYISLFESNGKRKFNYIDASFLFRKLYDTKQIIESVSENDFRQRVYDKLDLCYGSKLKGLTESSNIHREIIFKLVKKQNCS